MTAKIALVDDDANIVASLGIFLESEGYEVKIYSDGQAAMDGLIKEPVDLMILDMKMPKLDGLETLTRIRGSDAPLKNLPVIFLTSKADEADQLAGFANGADDYVTKPFSQSLLLQRVKAVLRRHMAPTDSREDSREDNELIRRGDLELDQRRHLCLWKGGRIDLTVTEFLLLQTLVQRPGFVKTRDQLIDAAYGENVYVDDRIIDSHIKRLRRKFKDFDSAFDEIETLYGAGYRYRAL